MRMMSIKHIHSSVNTWCETPCPFLVSDILLLSRLSFKLQLVCELILNPLPHVLVGVTRAPCTNSCKFLSAPCLSVLEKAGLSLPVPAHCGGCGAGLSVLPRPRGSRVNHQRHSLSYSCWVARRGDLQQYSRNPH